MNPQLKRIAELRSIALLKPLGRKARGRIDRWRHSPARNIFYGVAFVLLVSLCATLGYMWHGWSLGDSIYMVVVTVFTVGYGEVRPVDTMGLRAITMGLILTGCTGMIFITGALVQAITLSQITTVLGHKRMNRQIDELRGHVIVCGFGRTGWMLARELAAAKAAFVVLESDDARYEEARELGYLCMQVDASDESALLQAGIVHARALATVVSSDAVNVFVTLTARGLNAKLQIIARGQYITTEKKLLQAGADAVVMPAHIGAEQVASMILFPGLAGMIHDSERRRQMEIDLRTLGLEIEVVLAAAGSRYIGLTVGEIERASEQNFIIVAIERAGSLDVERPGIGTRIEAGDGVTILGRNGREALQKVFGV